MKKVPVFWPNFYIESVLLSKQNLHDFRDITNSVRICHYTTFTNLSMKYLVMCKVYTGVGGIK